MATSGPRAPRVVMMCGPGGAGKTTYYERFEPPTPDEDPLTIVQ